jgi:hypothetical protein
MRGRLGEIVLRLGQYLKNDIPRTRNRGGSKKKGIQLDDCIVLECLRNSRQENFGASGYLGSCGLATCAHRESTSGRARRTIEIFLRRIHQVQDMMFRGGIVRIWIWKPNLCIRTKGHTGKTNLRIWEWRAWFKRQTRFPLWRLEWKEAYFCRHC